MEFEPSLYQCFENCGSLKLTVSRHGGDPGVTVKVCVCVCRCVWGYLGEYCVYITSMCVLGRAAKRHSDKSRDQRKLWTDFTGIVGSFAVLDLVFLTTHSKDFKHPCFQVWTDAVRGLAVGDRGALNLNTHYEMFSSPDFERSVQVLTQRKQISFGGSSMILGLALASYSE